MTKRSTQNLIQRRQSELQQARRKQLEDLSNMREWAYLEGQKLARKLFSTITLFKGMPSSDGQHHQAEFEAARGFADGLNIAIDDLRSLVPADSRRNLLAFLIDDLATNAEKAVHIMGEGQVSPWIVHAEKLRSNDGNGKRLQMLTVGLYRRYEAFDVGRCLSGLGEDYRATAIEMLDSFSRLGRNDRAFMDAAENLLRGDDS